MSNLMTVSSCEGLALEKAIEELYSASRSYTGCPKLIEPHWINGDFQNQEVLVLPLFSGGTEVAASPLSAGTDWLNIKHHEAPLALYPDADGYVDSSEVIRAFNTYLTTLTGYQSSTVELPLLKVELQAMENPLNLLLTIPVDNKQQERIYYLIADGNGNWKRVLPETLENS